VAPIPEEISRWIRAWNTKYPGAAAEDACLAPFAGARYLTEAQATALVKWKFQSDARRRAAALAGVGEWESASAHIAQALAAADDYGALKATAWPGGGIKGWGPAMGSVLLAMTQPERFTIIDSRALASLKSLGLLDVGHTYGELRDWLPYLGVCRSLAKQSNVLLREVDRALFAANGDNGLPTA
jgi:hypothetical protein